MSMNFDQVKAYWNDRAKSDSTAQSTTQDFYLRSIEVRVLSKLLQDLKPRTVIDVGCGDARTTCALAQQYPETSFLGLDYSEAMIQNARNVIESVGLRNVRVDVSDITDPVALPPAELIYTTRCLINITDRQLQYKAIDNISRLLACRGYYIMIENFIEGHNNFNEIRRQFGLPEISIRKHNLFFDKESLMECIKGKFEVVDDVNISSTYYMATRVLYSKICQIGGTTPDYFDIHHQLAADLPFAGECGPVRMLVLKKV